MNYANKNECYKKIDLIIQFFCRRFSFVVCPEDEKTYKEGEKSDEFGELVEYETHIINKFDNASIYLYKCFDNENIYNTSKDGDTYIMGDMYFEYLMYFCELSLSELNKFLIALNKEEYDLLQQLESKIKIRYNFSH